LDSSTRYRTLTDCFLIKLERLALLPQIVHARDLIVPDSPKNLLFTVLTIGTRGDVQPFIALCKGLQREGHRCRIATHLEYQTWIEQHGLEFREIKGDPAEIMQLCVNNGMFSISFIHQVFSRFRGWMSELLESAWEACKDTDVLIEAAGALGAGIHIAEKIRVPLFRSFMMPWTRTGAFPHPFAPALESHLPRSYNVSTFAVSEQVIWAGTRNLINRWRKETLKLPPKWTLDTRHIPFLYGISPVVLPPPPDWPDWVHVCGYWFLDRPDTTWDPPAELKEFLDVDPTQTVYIGFGSIVVPDPGASKILHVCPFICTKCAYHA
jgi:UDP:flavonoid glycosyltransferase YjiC (YdhE family)